MNPSVFSSATPRIPAAGMRTRNEAGGIAYQRSDKEALAQLVVTGTFHDTFYTTGQQGLQKVQELLPRVDPEFVAKLAIYGASRAFMKDTPVFLTAYLAGRNPRLFDAAADVVLSNGKAIRNFVQVIRSGATGRKSLGTGPKKKVATWIEQASTQQLLNAYIGAKPSLKDVIALSHPRPDGVEREQLFKFLMGKPVDNPEALPQEVRDLLRFRATKDGDLPDVPFLLLTSEALTEAQWKTLALNCSWNQLRQNLNSFARHGVFTDPKVTEALVQKIQDPGKTQYFPYQILTTLNNLAPEVPAAFTHELQLLLEESSKFIPKINDLAVIVDSSGSMSAPATGYREGGTSKTTCSMVAGLVASCLIRRSEQYRIISFDTSAQEVSLNPLDSIFTNAKKLFRNGGGTNCAAPLIHLLRRGGSLPKNLVMISDNESWFHPTTNPGRAWSDYRKAQPEAKMVCVDVTPTTTTPFPIQNVFRIGGFSDEVFNAIDRFFTGEGEASLLVQQIEEVQLE